MSWLYPITHNIPWFIRTPTIELLGSECYTNLIYDLKFDHLFCLKFGLSKLISLTIVLGSGIVKLPQIIKIIKLKSARGLSLSSYWLDSFGHIIIIAYNYRHEFPVTTYGESFLLLIQNLIIINLIIVLANHSMSRLLSLFVISIPIGLLTLTLVPNSPIPSSLLQALLTLTIPLGLGSKIPQIMINFERKTTGPLSRFLVTSSFLGCLARLFTTLTETGDWTLLCNFGLGSALNGILVYQLITYSKNQPTSHRTQSTNDVELERLTSSNGLTTPNRRHHYNNSTPKIDLNSPKQWTRKAD
ncbi:hypothetical protein O181_043336 [Austropuccinia psidii MF-1]|uniref:Mannose-P-dolichol utilization defect 1 protein homolog n=1 Tax=Austropuccinia psidii MF-1 TaxID=1389203 RepID=A0A9Q3HFW4_9BASI|nr:hypothetical protein [Austropuccinia psidii MF-1]